MKAPPWTARQWALAAWMLAAAGVLLRLIQYAWNRSWWGDEARLVLNLLERPARELMGPLDLNQAAPPLFLWIERAALVALGSGGPALRLFPLICGAASVALVAAVAVRELRRSQSEVGEHAAAGPGAVLATGIIAFSPALIWHSAEAKQYSSDVLAATILWAMVLWNGNAARGKPHLRWWPWSAAAAVLVWASYSAIFVVAGIAMVEVVWRWRREAWRVRALFNTSLPVVLPILSFALLYFLVIRHQQQEDLYDYWDDRFADWSRPWTVPFWALRGTNSVFNYPIRNGGTFLLILAACGVIGLWRAQRRREAMILVAPILLTLLAGAAGQYPFPGRRLTAFLSPAVCWLAGAGLDAALWFVRQQWPSRSGRQRLGTAVGALIALAPLALGAGENAYYLFVPQHRGHIRPAFAHLRSSHGEAEPIVILGQAVTFELYAAATDQARRLVPLLGVSPETMDADPAAAEQLLHQARSLADGGRFWIIFEHARPSSRRRYLEAVAAAAPDAQVRVDVDGAMLLEVPPEDE